MADEDSQPIIIIRKKITHAGHHGGSWKVAFADFMTAMMAFFLVLWLVGQDQELKDAVAGYFMDPIGFDRGGRIGVGKGAGLMKGSTGVMSKAEASRIATRTLNNAAQKILYNLSLSPDYDALKNNITVQVTPEGLRIELSEGDDSISFFEPGSAKMNPVGEAILTLIGEEVAKLHNRIAFEGHTDASGAANLFGYSNWDLGADRANFCRKVLTRAGIRSTQVKEVRSYADTKLADPDNPSSGRNRRVSILVLNDFEYLLENNLIEEPILDTSTSANTLSQVDTTAAARPDDEVPPVDEDTFKIPEYLRDSI
ncbi:MAG: OmpA family protein [candidate division Zixibacteria bacterium]|nr:OmpA family protein [candidate division Zixibacteria bacterium]